MRGENFLDFSWNFPCVMGVRNVGEALTLRRERKCDGLAGLGIEDQHQAPLLV